MAPVFATLKKAPYLILTLILTIVFMALYTFFDLRQGGTHLTIFSTHLMPLQFFIDRFGVPFVVSKIVLDLLIALLTAALIAVMLNLYRAGNPVLTGTACSTSATIFLGLFTFGCPTCVLPIAGTIGALFTAQALPFLGLEFKVLSLLIIIGTFAWLLQRVRKAEPKRFAVQ